MEELKELESNEILSKGGSISLLKLAQFRSTL